MLVAVPKAKENARKRSYFATLLAQEKRTVCGADYKPPMHFIPKHQTKHSEWSFCVTEKNMVWIDIKKG